MIKTLICSGVQHCSIDHEKGIYKIKNWRAVEVFEMSIWRRMEKISWTEPIANEEVIGREIASIHTK